MCTNYTKDGKPVVLYVPGKRVVAKLKRKEIEGTIPGLPVQVQGQNPVFRRLGDANINENFCCTAH
jgi:hypothetical protein